VVYQAANFDYYGEHKSAFLFHPQTGETFHKMMLANRTSSKGEIRGAGPRGDRCKALYAAGELERKVLRQFRYIYWLDRKARDLCAMARKPYPKV